MANANLTLNISLKWYAKPVLYFCVLFGLPIPNFVFTIGKELNINPSNERGNK